MKKVIRLTESDLTNIVKRVISEQTEERKFIIGVQKFLNAKRIYGYDNKPLVPDGKTGEGSETEMAISKYQKSIGARNHGYWGEETWNMMPPKDKEMLKNIIAKEGGLIDRFLNWIGL
jgi:hypothetical protein